MRLGRKRDSGCVDAVKRRGGVLPACEPATHISGTASNNKYMGGGPVLEGRDGRLSTNWALAFGWRRFEFGTTGPGLMTGWLEWCEWLRWLILIEQEVLDPDSHLPVSAVVFIFFSFVSIHLQSTKLLGMRQRVSPKHKTRERASTLH